MELGLCDSSRREVMKKQDGVFLVWDRGQFGHYGNYENGFFLFLFYEQLEIALKRNKYYKNGE